MSLRIIYVKLSQASVLLPVFTALPHYRKLTLPFRILFYFFVLSVGFEIQSSICGILFHNSNPGQHLFTFVEFLAFSAVYYLYFPKNNVMRLLIGINAVAFIIAAFADALLIHGIWESNTLSRSYSSISLICYALVYFYFQFSKYILYRDSPMFWIGIGVLVYFGLNMFYFMLDAYLMDRAVRTANIALLTHDTINIIGNCLFAQSFRCFRKQEAVS